MYAEGFGFGRGGLSAWGWGELRCGILGLIGRGGGMQRRLAGIWVLGDWAGEGRRKKKMKKRRKLVGLGRLGNGGEKEEKRKEERRRRRNKEKKKRKRKKEKKKKGLVGLGLD